ncbi:MAG: DUF2232 domain-containing protein [Hyphomicrobiaceae bacterium]
MPYGLLIGLGSGLASALLFYSAVRGGGWLGPVLFFLTPLPPLLAGLGWGWLPAAVGAVAGSLAIAAIAAAPLGVAYFLAVGLPAAFLAYLAYLSRPSRYDKDQREWYPLGRLLAALTLYAGALPVLALPWTGGSFEALRPMVTAMIQAVVKQSEELSQRPPSDAQIDDLAHMAVLVVPAAMAFYWLLIMTPNLYLAGRIAVGSGRLGRDWPDVPAFTYPAGFSLLLGLAVLASFAPGAVGIAGTSFAGALMFAHLLAGLALVHFIAQRGARWLLWVTYAALLFLQPYGAILVALAGLIEPVLKLKQRLGPPPPSA